MVKTTDCRIRIGTSGYSFKDWAGTFYPEKIRQADMLPYYATKFDTVEVNYTYYRMPSARTMASMTERTPDDFAFFVKAHKSFTHEHDLSGVDEFKEELGPMAEAGKLSGLLFQFPQSFKNNEENRSYLGEVSDRFEDSVVAVEFRDKSWNRDAIYSFLSEKNLSFVSVDEPQISTLFPRVGRATGPIGYLRFHSRNGANWYKGPVKRYDYNYSEEEMREWIPTLEAVASAVRSIFIYFNNCHGGQAAQNAETMKQLMA